MHFTTSAPVIPNSYVRLGCALSCDHLNIINLGFLLLSLGTHTILGDGMWVVWHLWCDTGYEAAGMKHPSWHSLSTLPSPSLTSASGRRSEEEMRIWSCSVSLGSRGLCGAEGMIDWVLFSLLVYCLLTGGVVTLWNHCSGDESWLDVLLTVEKGAKRVNMRKIWKV